MAPYMAADGQKTNDVREPRPDPVEAGARLPGMRMGSLTAGLVFGCALIGLAGPGGALAESIEARSLEPLVFLDGRFPVACGFEAAVEVAGRPVRVAVLNRKTAAGSEFAVSVEGAGRLRSVGVSAGEVRDAEGFSSLAEVAPGRYERARAFTPDEGAMFIQSLMVGGGTVSFEPQDGHRVEVWLKGPLPQSVRASYLNCAGDLVRPE